MSTNGSQRSCRVITTELINKFHQMIGNGEFKVRERASALGILSEQECDILLQHLSKKELF